MLEWVCPKCGRSVDPGLDTCPFCRSAESAQTAGPAAAIGRSPRRGREPFQWADVDRGFRFGLGLVAAVACAYFLLFLATYVADHPTWLDKLHRWLRP